MDPAGPFSGSLWNLEGSFGIPRIDRDSIKIHPNSGGCGTSLTSLKDPPRIFKDLF